ncbi:hypothetical protein HDU86_005435 [Geranomyces michiganensis]|nr:hypothetical protein HDU86_005435 [Geranomyces michiganensis]
MTPPAPPPPPPPMPLPFAAAATARSAAAAAPTTIGYSALCKKLNRKYDLVSYSSLTTFLLHHVGRGALLSPPQMRQVLDSLERFRLLVASWTHFEEHQREGVGSDEEEAATRLYDALVAHVAGLDEIAAKLRDTAAVAAQELSETDQILKWGMRLKYRLLMEKCIKERETAASIVFQRYIKEEHPSASTGSNTHIKVDALVKWMVDVRQGRECCPETRQAVCAALSLFGGAGSHCNRSDIAAYMRDWLWRFMRIKDEIDLSDPRMLEAEPIVASKDVAFLLQDEFGSPSSLRAWACNAERCDGFGSKASEGYRVHEQAVVIAMVRSTAWRSAPLLAEWKASLHLAVPVASTVIKRFLVQGLPPKYQSSLG